MSEYIKIEKRIKTVKEFLDALPTINLKPQYQREFVYNDEEASKVIDSILLGLPLNILYLNENENSSFKYEVIDGQQRLRSIDNFVNHSHSLIKMSFSDWNDKVFSGLSKEQRQIIYDYKLEFYIVTKDNPSNTKLDLFRRINTVGKKLNDIEMINATYPGLFVDEIKKFCHDNEMKLKDVTGSDWLRGETEEYILNWYSSGNIPPFLAKVQHTSFNSSLYPKDILRILNWIQDIVEKKFRNKIYKVSELKRLYDKYSTKTFDKNKLKLLCSKYMALGDEIGNKKGILEYSLQEINRESPDEQLLQLRAFPAEWKEEFAKLQGYKCNICGKDLTDDIEYAKAELDHVISWKKGGLTEKSNCQLLCQKCNRHKGGH